MKILYVGSLQPNSNSFARFKTLKEMGHTIQGLDTEPILFNGNPIWSRTHHFLNLGPGIFEIGNQLVHAVRDFQPDLIWVDNKPFIPLSAIKEIRKIKPFFLVAVVTDDAFGKYSFGWQILKKTMPMYDAHFVQRIVNIAEYQKLGAKLVLECDRSFDPSRHYPVELSDDDLQKWGSEIGFIGTYASYRAGVLSRLIQKGFPVSIWGNDWEGKPEWSIIQPHFRGKAEYGENYRKILSGMKIALHFLRKENRDDQDSRTFEIPACGAFMLAERTPKHLRYFEEGKEAEFFEDEQGLECKLKFYLENLEIAKTISINGRERCLSSGYDHRSRLQFVLNSVEKPESGRNINLVS